MDLALLDAIALGAVIFAVVWCLRRLLLLEAHLREVLRPWMEEQETLNFEIAKALKLLETGHLTHAARLREQDDTDGGVAEKIQALEDATRRR